MPRKSFWIVLTLAVALACSAILGAAPAASASPAHALRPAAQQHAAIVSACSPGYHLAIYLNESVFNNYTKYCYNFDNCTVGSPVTITTWTCLYQNSNYGGQEIAFYGDGCANLTDFAGPGPGGTWNDAMSSFKWWVSGDTSPQVDAFWWNTNDSSYYNLYGPGWSSGTSYIGNTWNDQASSLNINYKPSGC
jgi:hypothetical protein